MIELDASQPKRNNKLEGNSDTKYFFNLSLSFLPPNIAVRIPLSEFQDGLRQVEVLRSSVLGAP